MQDIELGEMYEELDGDGNPTGFRGMCTTLEPGPRGKRRIESMSTIVHHIDTDQRARGFRRVDNGLKVQLPPNVEARLDKLEAEVAAVPETIDEGLDALDKRMRELEKVDGRTVAALKKKVAALEDALKAKVG